MQVRPDAQRSGLKPPHPPPCATADSLLPRWTGPHAVIEGATTTARIRSERSNLVRMVISLNEVSDHLAPSPSPLSSTLVRFERSASSTQTPCETRPALEAHPTHVRPRTMPRCAALLALR